MPAFQKSNRRASKLSVPEVQEIRHLYNQGRLTQGDLSRRFGVSVIQIGRIVRGEVWQQLPTLEHLMSQGELKESAARMLEMQEKLQAESAAKLQADAAELKKADGFLEELINEPRNPLDE